MSQMVEVKTTELSGTALRWAVAQAEGLEVTIHPPAYGNGHRLAVNGRTEAYRPDMDWSQGGPLIDKYHVQTNYNGRGFRTASGEYWCAYVCADSGQEIYPSGGGGTPLIAACRAIVSAKLGDSVSVPSVLLEKESV